MKKGLFSDDSPAYRTYISPIFAASIGAERTKHGYRWFFVADGAVDFVFGGVI
jgi:hypothetical protein